MNIKDEQIAFSEWFDDLWLGDLEHDQRIPTIQDSDYGEYLEARQLAQGAWMHRAQIAATDVAVEKSWQRFEDKMAELEREKTVAAAPPPPAQQDDEALEPDMQSAWISVQDRMPPDDTPVLVYVPGNEMLAFAIDQWQMQREAPLGWSSATIETGMGWGDHDYEDVSHWMPLTAPGHPLAMPAVPDDALRAENERLIAAIKSLAMPAQAQPLRLPEPMTDAEVHSLLDDISHLPSDLVVREIEATVIRRVKEANE